MNSMQIFEVIKLENYPYCKTMEISSGEKVKEVLLDDNNQNKVFLLIDHDLKRIWTFNCPKSSFMLQVYGSIIANMFRVQLKLYYRIFLLNSIKIDSKEFQEMLDKPLGGGRAKAIIESDFPKQDQNVNQKPYLHVDTNIKFNEAIEILNNLPPIDPEKFMRRLIIIGGSIYTEEDIPKEFVQEEKSINKPIKLGQLNNGFTLFDDHEYSTRIIIKDRKLQAIELLIQKEDKSPSLKLVVPVIPEEKFSTSRRMDLLSSSFNIPDKYIEDKKE